MTKLEQIELALLRNAVEGLTNQRDDYAAHLETMQYEMDAIPAIKAERDAYAKAADDMAASHKVERDELRSTINAACISAIRQEREIDALEDAARLALDLVNDLEPLYWDSRKDKKRHTDTVEALKAVL